MKHTDLSGYYPIYIEIQFDEGLHCGFEEVEFPCSADDHSIIHCQYIQNLLLFLPVKLGRQS